MKKIFLGLIFGFLLFSCKESVKDDSTNEALSVEENSKQIDSITNDSITIKDAPAFKLEDINGDLKSLSSYKGKLILMDIWATWCGPCIAQGPYIKELEEKYKNENIQFLSISIDTERDKEKWKKMVKEKNLAGAHLFAGAGSSFPLDYNVDFIPRFVLISPDGKILIENTPQVINMTGDGVNEDLVKLLDFSLAELKKASQ